MKIRNYLLFLAFLTGLQSISAMQFCHAPTTQELEKYSPEEITIALDLSQADQILFKTAKNILWTVPDGFRHAVPLLEKLAFNNPDREMKKEVLLLLCRIFYFGLGNAPLNHSLSQEYMLAAIKELPESNDLIVKIEEYFSGYAQPWPQRKPRA